MILANELDSSSGQSILLSNRTSDPPITTSPHIVFSRPSVRDLVVFFNHKSRESTASSTPTRSKERSYTSSGLVKTLVQTFHEKSQTTPISARGTTSPGIPGFMMKQDGGLTVGRAVSPATGQRRQVPTEGGYPKLVPPVVIQYQIAITEDRKTKSENLPEKQEKKVRVVVAEGYKLRKTRPEPEEKDIRSSPTVSTTSVDVERAPMEKMQVGYSGTMSPAILSLENLLAAASGAVADNQAIALPQTGDAVELVVTSAKESSLRSRVRSLDGGTERPHIQNRAVGPSPSPDYFINVPPKKKAKERIPLPADLRLNMVDISSTPAPLKIVKYRKPEQQIIIGTPTAQPRSSKFKIGLDPMSRTNIGSSYRPHLAPPAQRYVVSVPSSESSLSAKNSPTRSSSNGEFSSREAQQNTLESKPPSNLIDSAKPPVIVSTGYNNPVTALAPPPILPPSRKGTPKQSLLALASLNASRRSSMTSTQGTTDGDRKIVTSPATANTIPLTTRESRTSASSLVTGDFVIGNSNRPQTLPRMKIRGDMEWLKSRKGATMGGRRTLIPRESTVTANNNIPGKIHQAALQPYDSENIDNIISPRVYDGSSAVSVMATWTEYEDEDDNYNVEYDDDDDNLSHEQYMTFNDFVDPLLPPPPPPTGAIRQYILDANTTAGKYHSFPRPDKAAPPPPSRNNVLFINEKDTHIPSPPSPSLQPSSFLVPIHSEPQQKKTLLSPASYITQKISSSRPPSDSHAQQPLAPPLVDVENLTSSRESISPFIYHHYSRHLSGKRGKLTTESLLEASGLAELGIDIGVNASGMMGFEAGSNISPSEPVMSPTYLSFGGSDLEDEGYGVVSRVGNGRKGKRTMRSNLGTARGRVNERPSVLTVGADGIWDNVVREEGKK